MGVQETPKKRDGGWYVHINAELNKIVLVKFLKFVLYFILVKIVQGNDVCNPICINSIPYACNLMLIYENAYLEYSFTVNAFAALNFY